MKRIGAFVLFLICLLGQSYGQSAQRHLRIICDDWRPYQYLSGELGNQHITGFSTEVLQVILKKVNVSVKDAIEQFPWARAERMLLDGSADVLYTAAESVERQKLALYPSESLMESSWSFFIRAEDKKRLGFTKLDDLKGFTIGVVRGYAYTPEIWQFMKVQGNFELSDSDATNVKKLMAKRIDFIIMDFGNGMSLLKQAGLSNNVICLEKPLKLISLYVIFSKKNLDKAFVDRFSAELKAFKASAEYKALFKKYFGA